jgi:hypothetical protein
MKRLTQSAQRPRAPSAQSAPWMDWEKLPGFALLGYAIAWFGLLAAFIGN